MLLDCAEDNNIDLPYSSRAGASSTETARLVSGTIDNNDQNFLGDAELGAGYFLTDTAYACSDVTFIGWQEEELYAQCYSGQPNCTAGTTCLFDGQTVSSGSSVTAYQSATAPEGQSCVSQQRVCSNGWLSGTFSFPTCTAGAGCTFNGQTVASGGTVTAYLTNQVPDGQTCQSETRTCTNGTLSGSYTYPACTVSFSPAAGVH